MNEFKEEEYTKRFDFSLWRRLLVLTRPYVKYMLGLGVVMICVATIDALFPILNRHAIDNFIIPKSMQGFGLFTACYGLLILVQASNVFLLIALAGKIEMGISYDLRKTAFHRLQELSYSYYDKTPVGWIMARMTSDTQRLGETISWGLVDMVWGGTMMSAIAIFMLIMNWRLALITLAVVPILTIISVFFQQKILKSYRIVRKTNSRISGSFNEGIMGAKTTKTLVREQENLNEFSQLTGEMRYHSIKAAVFSALYLPIVLGLGSIGTGFALWYGGQGVIAGVITYGTLVAFLAYTVQFFEPVRELARVLSELQNAQAAAERVISLIDTEPDIKDTKEVIARYGTTFAPREKNWPSITGKIDFSGVAFQYKDGEKVLDNFNLSVKPGENVALVGETGSGKSTIVNLACRFYEPSQGLILIDDVDYRKRSLLWLHSHIGYVLQTPHLFNGTIFENIRYGNLSATMNEVEKAAKLVNAHDFIVKLERGYQTEVGEGGGLLSTGEKQLISFARAIISDPVIFILDEATSSIDTETELKIQSAIKNVLRDRTSFIIAHRLSTIKSADRILVIHKGNIIEEGNHVELIQQRGQYYRLYTNQFLEEEEVHLLNT